MEACAYWAKKLNPAAAAVLTIALLLTGAGCAKDEKPPVIQQVDMPERVVEDVNVKLTVRTADDRGAEEVYVQFDSIDKILLTKTDSQKNGEEISNWAASFRLSPKDYSYSIVAEDKAGNKSDPKEGKITVYSKDSLYGYTQGKGIDTYLSQIVSLEKNGIVDANGRAFIDLVAKYPKAGELVPGTYAELLLLPDLSLEKYLKIDERDLKAAEKIIKLASDPKYTSAFLNIDSVGIKAGRKYGALWEALLWEAYDDKNLSDFLEPYSMEKLVKDAWTNTSTSSNYSKDRWGDYNEVVTRLSFPEGAYWYLRDNMGFVPDPSKTKYPEELFDKKYGGCDDYSLFITHCLFMSGYGIDKFEKTPEIGYPDYNFEPNEDNAVCTLFFWKGINWAHFIPLVKKNNQIYVFDATPFENSNRGPFKSIRDVLDANPGWTSAFIRGNQPYKCIGVVLSEYTKTRLKNKDYRDKAKELLKMSHFFVYGTAEDNTWILEYFDNYDK